LLSVFIVLAIRQPTGHWLDDLKRRFDLWPLQLGVLAISLASLTVLPLFRLGFNNDLVMRASIPSLFVLWVFTARIVVEAVQCLAARQAPLKLRLAAWLLVGVVVAGFMPALAEVTRSLQSYRFGPPPLEAVVPAAEADPRHLVEQRVGDGEAFFFRYLAR
jgi:hypothetical protein